MQWLRGDLFVGQRNEFLSLVPREELWEWVDQNLEKRAWYLASFAPPNLNPNSLARDVLIRYGDRPDVKRNLMGNFSTEGWAGPASGHYAQKKHGLQALLEGETVPRVRAWIEEYIARIDESIRQAQVGEEREEF